MSSLSAVVLCASVAAPMWAATQTPANVEVSVRPPVGYVGEIVRVPVYVEGTGAEALRDLSLEFRFPSKLMEAVEVERGFLLRDAGVDVAHRVVTHPDDTSTLVVTLSSGTGLPEGLVLYVRFRVDGSAPLGGEIPLDLRAEARMGPGTGPALATVPVKGDPLRISPRKKEDEFIFACFFYMH